MTEILLVILIILVLINIVIGFTNKFPRKINSVFHNIEKSIENIVFLLKKTEEVTKDEFQRNRKEINEITKLNREELGGSLKSFEENFSQNIKNSNELLRQHFNDFSKQQFEINKQLQDNLNSIKDTIEKQLKLIRDENTKQLDEMRKTVDEKLQKTLNARLNHSFETVGQQLLSVQKGLGEMRTLASDVGGLKKILGNVKLRGSFGEMQLSMLLEQILAPEQYEKNVKTKKNSSDIVEFAIKLPGKDDSQNFVFLPIDAKFPKDAYEKLQEAYEDEGEEKILSAEKNFETSIKKMAKDMHDKYINPPATTDFGIIFLPFESIYAEIVKRASLLEILQKDFKTIVTGPTTLAAILNSLQMGFKTLAIQKRSSEVWQVLATVKKEFNKFEDLMGKAQKNIQTGLNQLDDVIGVRTRAITKKLKNVETLQKEKNNLIGFDQKIEDIDENLE